MIRTTILKDLEVKAASSTPVERFTHSTEICLNVCFQERENSETKKITSLAKSPGGSIVEIAYTDSADKASEGTSIFYRL